MTSNFICTPEYTVNGTSVDYQTYCEHQKTLKRRERYYYCQNPGCYEGFDVKVRNPRTTMFCCDECNHAYKRHIGQQSIIEYNLNPNLCHFDSKPILCDSSNPKDLIDIKRKKFCNQSCSTKYNNKNRGGHSEETKNKISISMKASPIRYNPNPKGQPIYIRNKNTSNKKQNKNKIPFISKKTIFINAIGRFYPLHCNDSKCMNFFLSKSPHKKYCEQCIKKHMGGYKPNSSRGRKGYYHNIWCDSSWELAYVIYCIDNGISIQRCEETFTYYLDGVKRKYHPDFIVNGIIVEIKGNQGENVELKQESVGDKPYQILYRKDIQPILKYVMSQYNVNEVEIHTLYEDYKPEYRKCNRDECENQIEIIPSKRNNQYCSHKCSRMHICQINGKDFESRKKEYDKNPKICKQKNCTTPLPYKDNIKKISYCSQGCINADRKLRSKNNGAPGQGRTDTIFSFEAKNSSN